jgi:hypothetical protein
MSRLVAPAVAKHSFHHLVFRGDSLSRRNLPKRIFALRSHRLVRGAQPACQYAHDIEREERRPTYKE